MPIHPIAQRMLDEARASGRPNAHLLPIHTARNNYVDSFASLSIPAIHRISEFAVPTRDGSAIPARLYLPAERPGLPLTVYFHGGGWLLGSIESHDVPTRLLAQRSGSAVLSVGYRRGPEWRFPTALHDAIDAVNWVSTGVLPGVDTEKLAVAGDSAGGNLATAVALDARAAGPNLLHQLLIYPVTTTDLKRGLDPAFDGVMLERDELQWHQDNYLPNPQGAGDPRINVLDADLGGAPETTVILAECDPIRPQGERYANALAAARVPVQTRLAPGMVHGFFGFDEVFPAAAAAMTFAGERLARALR